MTMNGSELCVPAKCGHPRVLFVDEPADWSTMDNWHHTDKHDTKPSVLYGPDLVLLALYRILFPKALLSEVAAFVWNAWGRLQNALVLYGLPNILKAETRLGLTRKKGSTTAYQAYFPINTALQQTFWTQPWPYGMANI